MSGGFIKAFGGKVGIRFACAMLLAGVTGGQGDAALARPSFLPASYYGMDDADRDDGLLRDVALGMQNEERESLGLEPLAWDSALAADAARYAREMARTNLFRHSARTSRSVPSGENLWMGSRGLYDYDVMVGSFLDEKRYFRRGGKLPDISTTGRWADVGHYSQIIWRSTRKVGCALAEGQSYDYLVCRYYPAGNMFGMGPLDRDPGEPAQFAGGER